MEHDILPPIPQNINKQYLSICHTGDGEAERRSETGMSINPREQISESDNRIICTRKIRRTNLIPCSARSKEDASTHVQPGHLPDYPPHNSHHSDQLLRLSGVIHHDQGVRAAIQQFWRIPQSRHTLPCNRTPQFPHHVLQGKIRISFYFLSPSSPPSPPP